MPCPSIEDACTESRVVILDFWSEDCAPCRLVEPLLRRLVKELEDRGVSVKLVRVNVVECPELAAKYGVLGLPTVVLLIDCREVLRHTGGPVGLRRKILRTLEMFGE